MKESLSKISILIVDDEPLVSETLIIIFNRKGFDVRKLDSAQQAIDLFKEGTYSPDVVIVDYSLGEADGITTINTLQELNNKCGYILCTGASELPEIDEEVTWKLVRKPFRISDMLDVVETLAAK